MRDSPMVQEWMPPHVTNAIAKARKLEQEVGSLDNYVERELGALVHQRLMDAGITPPEFISYDLSYWGWDCPDSPIGKCVYDSDEDPCHDECIICGNPEERK